MKIFNNCKVALIALCAVFIVSFNGLVASDANKTKHPILVGSASVAGISFAGEMLCKLAANKVEKCQAAYLEKIKPYYEPYQKKTDAVNEIVTGSKKECLYKAGVEKTKAKQQLAPYLPELDKINNTIKAYGRDAKMFGRVRHVAIGTFLLDCVINTFHNNQKKSFKDLLIYHE